MYIKLHEKIILAISITAVICLSCLIFLGAHNSRAESYTPKSKNHANAHHVPAIVKQVIKSFDNPEGAIFSADGKFVFISNSAEIGDRDRKSVV